MAGCDELLGLDSPGFDFGCCTCSRAAVCCSCFAPRLLLLGAFLHFFDQLARSETICRCNSWVFLRRLLPLDQLLGFAHLIANARERILLAALADVFARVFGFWCLRPACLLGRPVSSRPTFSRVRAAVRRPATGRYPDLATVARRGWVCQRDVWRRGPVLPRLARSALRPAERARRRPARRTEPTRHRQREPCPIEPQAITHCLTPVPSRPPRQRAIVGVPAAAAFFTASASSGRSPSRITGSFSGLSSGASS